MALTRPRPARRPSPRTPRPGALWPAGPVPVALLGVLLFVAGGYWDIAWHIDLGRDTFWSPPHLVLYSGLLLIALTPLWGLLQARHLRGLDPRHLAGPTVRLAGLPLSPGLLISGLGALLALGAAPLDELWHQLFGLDVSLWSPPHLQLIFGAALALLGALAALAGERHRARPEYLTAQPGPFPADGRDLALALGFGLLLLVLLGVLAEYTFGIPHLYPLVWHPLLLGPIVLGVLTAGARALGSRWGATVVALSATVLTLALNGLLLLLGRTTPTPTVLLPAALVLDALWTARPDHRPRAVLPPALLATLVLLASQTHNLQPEAAVPWPLEAWPWALPAALALGAAGALVGARLGAALRPVPRWPAPPRPRRGPLALALLLLALGPLVVQAHALETFQAEFRLLDPPAVVGQPAAFALRFDPPAVAPGSLRLTLEQGGQEIPVVAQPTDQPGLFTGTFTLPRPGLWALRLQFRDDHNTPWLGWAGVRGLLSPESRTPIIVRLRATLQPDRTRPPTAQDQVGLAVGKAAVWLVVLTAVGGAAWALRVVEQDGLTLAGARG